MDFNSIAARHPRDSDLPDRAFHLSMLRKVMESTFYDILPHPFHTEQTTAGEYVPVANRRPNVTYRFLRQVVNDSISFLFGEARFPIVDCPDELTRDIYRDIIAETKMVGVMREAALLGAIGSVAVHMRVLKQRLHFKAMCTIHLTPTFDPEEPDTLIKIVEKYKVRGRDLVEMGYQIKDDALNEKFWFQRVFDTQGEWWFFPLSVGKQKLEKSQPSLDRSRSVEHKLGFLPFVWIKNLPGGCDEIDGAATIAPALDMSIAIDYQLSQSGRALKYSADPVLLLKEPAQSDGNFVRSASNAIVVDQDGDGKLLEINGSSSNAVIEYVKWLRECALESLHANRANADRMSAAQSGAALKLHYAPMIQLADSLRSSYGDGLLKLVDLIRKASDRVPLRVYGDVIEPIDPKQRLHLRWPEFFVPTPHDSSLQAATLTQLREGGLISRETGIKELAAEMDIHDINHEIASIKSDEAENDAREKALAAGLAQVKVSSRID